MKMQTSLIVARLLVSTLSVALSLGAAASLKPVGLRTEWLQDPVGIDKAQPRVSWRVEAPERDRDQKQTAYRILASGSERELDRDHGDLWDSGKVLSSETLNVPYTGTALPARQQVFWKVKVWDRDGKESRWSEPAGWSMGLMTPRDWTAQWISFRDRSPVHADRKKLELPPARHYRAAFGSEKKPRRATLYFSALGIAEMHLNGERVSDALFEPGWSDYLKRAYYRSHDVTKLVKRGENCLGAIVTDGWYAGYVGYGLLVGYGPNKSGRNFYGKTPALVAQLEIDYDDGSRQVIGTGPEWEVSGDGPIREADLIMGEAFDARRDSPDWCRQGGAAQWTWEHAIRAEENGSIKAPYSDTLGTRQMELGFQRPPSLQAYPAPPIRITGELKAQRITEPKPGVYIFDLGQNFAGTVRLKVKASAGARIQLRYGEMLHSDGRLMTENLRKARAADSYICRGGATETWTPRFTYHGFQYVEVTGLPAKPDLDAILGLPLHNDTPLTGEFACSDEVMTRFWKNTQWTQRANFIEVPTDCPQRDERLGWMGDAQIYARAASYNADVAAFFTKWVDDVREAQRDFGAYPDYCPYPMAHGAPGATHGTAWTDAGVIVPHTMWQVYGDVELVRRHWASMAKFMEWRRAADPQLKGVKVGNTWGDWLNVNEDTPVEYVDLCYHAQSSRMMAEMAGAAGHGESAAGYLETQDALRRNWMELYARNDGSLKVDTQSAYVLALACGMAAPDLRPKLAERLADKISRNGYRMTTGFLGTKPLLPVLTESGHNDLAVRLFQSRKFPSWGYEVINGANSVWERWDSFTKEHGFNGASGNQNASMNSFSHYSFGAVMQWGFQQLAGIDTEGPSFQQITIRPQPPSPGSNPDVKPIDWVSATYNSARGRIVSSWKWENEKLVLDVTVPANTSATVFIPASSTDSVTESGKPLRSANIKVLRRENGRAVAAIGSGRYHFEAK